MKRRDFLFMAPAILGSLAITNEVRKPPITMFFEDDGIVPNSKHPLLVYKKAFKKRNEAGALWLENRFLTNDWSNSWRNGIFDFQHYHSIAHEVLGIYSGEAEVLLGGEQGEKVIVEAGDIIIIPAGVGHKNLGSHNLGVVGAYPEGMPVDIVRCKPNDLPGTDKNIAEVPNPKTDPLDGSSGSLLKLWNY
ncbi:cupin domain-containing protein [Ekhidna sp.]|uniref:cupin domain-containing protein n=1 Tax=Ekhidna sp. TaxID=2608089 RepID=UPI0032EDB57B